MAHLNNLYLIGRLVHDAALKYTPQGVGVINFRLAVNETWKNKAGDKMEEKLFLDVEWWPKSPDNLMQYLGKGREILVEGKLKMREYEAKDGSKRTAYSCRADRVQFFWDGEKKEQGEQAAPAAKDDGEGLPF